MQVAINLNTTDSDNADSQSFLIATESVWRQTLPGGLPEFQPKTAVRAATWLYHACRFLVFRELETDALQRDLNVFVPVTNSPAEHYSVDLCLRFAKDVLRLSQAAAENDPLNQQILNVLQHWPLSGVGTSASTACPDVILNHHALRIVYLDRVVRLNDNRALQNSIVQTALTNIAGKQTELLPPLLRSVKSTEDV